MMQSYRKWKHHFPSLRTVFKFNFREKVPQTIVIAKLKYIFVVDFRTLRVRQFFNPPTEQWARGRSAQNKMEKTIMICCYRIAGEDGII